MANPQRFRKFLEEIANYESEWQYEDGASMNDDAHAFMKYVKALEADATSKMLSDAGAPFVHR